MHYPAASPRRIALALALVTGALVIAGILVVFARALGHDTVFGLLRKFDLDAELNVPTWFSTLLLSIAAAALAYIGIRARREGDRFSAHWRGLAWIFLFMSVDETAGLHGLLTRPVREALHLSGTFHFAWIVPVGIALIVFGVAYTRFVWNLPRPTRELMVLSGLVYVAGALGGEMLEGGYQTAHGIDVTFAALTVGEETFEMAGSVLFIYTLLAYIAARWGELRVSLPLSGK
jgi:hypothetical protein